jgi:hypothetical protein
MVSVVIPNWNGKHFLKECLGRLKKQTYPDLEVILVDASSRDSSVEFVRSSFPDVRIVELKDNRGFSVAANEGLRTARGEFIALLNNDALTDKKWVEELVKGIHSSDAIGFCASKILQAPMGIEIDTAGDCYTRYGVALKRGQNAVANQFSRPEFVFGACAAAALYRKAMLEEIGYFDEDLFCIYEDVDLSFRAQLRGFKCLYVPTAVVYHIVGGTAGMNNDFTLYYGQRNMASVFLKNMPAPFLLRYFPLHIGYMALAIIYHLSRGRGKVFLHAKADALGQIGMTLRKRKIVQRKRNVSSKYLQTIFDKRSLWQHVKGAV